MSFKKNCLKLINKLTPTLTKLLRTNKSFLTVVIEETLRFYNLLLTPLTNCLNLLHLELNFKRNHFPIKLYSAFFFKQEKLMSHDHVRQRKVHAHYHRNGKHRDRKKDE